MKEKKLLESLNQLDTDLLLETERAMEPRRVWRFGRRAALLATAVLTLVLSVSAAYLATHWDQSLLEWFEPSEAVLLQTEDAIQEVSAISQCGDVTLGVRQTLGDKMSLHLTLQAQLPDSVDLTPYSTEDPETGEMRNCGVLPTNLQVYSKPAKYEDISQMSYEKADAWLGEMGGSGQMTSVRTDSVDLETNTLTFPVSLSTESETGFQGSVTILIESFSANIDGEEQVLVEGPFVISWNANNQSEVLTFDLIDNGASVGSVRFSAFGLQVRLNHSDYTSCDDLMEKVFLCYNDGREESPRGTCGGSITLPGGAVELSWQFDEILLLSEIREVRIDGYHCILPADKSS